MPISILDLIKMVYLLFVQSHGVSKTGCKQKGEIYTSYETA
jgi:hypothetical protein